MPIFTQNIEGRKIITEVQTISFPADSTTFLNLTTDQTSIKKLLEIGMYSHSNINKTARVTDHLGNIAILTGTTNIGYGASVLNSVLWHLPFVKFELRNSTGTANLFTYQITYEILN